MTKSAPVPTGYRQSGQTTVEFAVTATVFILLFVGLMEIPLAVYDYNTVCSAAREAVRYAIVHSPTGPDPVPDSQIQAVAINSAVDLDPKQLTVSVSWPPDANLPKQEDARVAVSYNYQVQIPFLAPIKLTLSSASQMLTSQ